MEKKAFRWTVVVRVIRLAVLIVLATAEGGRKKQEGEGG